MIISVRSYNWEEYRKFEEVSAQFGRDVFGENLGSLGEYFRKLFK